MRLIEERIVPRRAVRSAVVRLAALIDVSHLDAEPQHYAAQVGDRTCGAIARDCPGHIESAKELNALFDGLSPRCDGRF